MARLNRLKARFFPAPTDRHWPSLALWIAGITGVLLLLGLVMSFSASVVPAAVAGDAFAVFRRQFMWAVLGVAGFFFASWIPLERWRQLAWPMLFGSIFLLLLLLIPGIGETRYGSTRWLSLGPLSVQPSEIAKLGLALWIADVLERKRARDGSPFALSHLFIPALPAFFVLALLVMAQPDLGTTLLLALIVFAVLFIEGLPFRWLASGGALVGAVAVWLAFSANYRSARIRGWLAPELYPLDEGFQLLQSWYALGTGGVFGIGLGASRGKWNFIPNADTDFIFAVIGEELGLIGSLTVVILFATLMFLGIKAAYLANSGFARTVAFTLTVWVCGQAFVNIGTVIGLLPITGVTLPLISVGGTSLVSTLLALGILTGVARQVQPETARTKGRA
jgi:cell division protein FtsW